MRRHSTSGFPVSVFWVFICMCFWFCLCFPWFSKHSRVAVVVLRFCLELFVVYFSGLFVYFPVLFVDFSVSKLSKPLSSSREAGRL